MVRRREEDVLAAQRAVLAEIRRGASNRTEAAKLAGENPRTVEKWMELDSLGWKKKVAQAEGKQQERWERRSLDVPPFIPFRKEVFGHDTPAHQMEWVEALAPTGLPLFPGDDTAKWDRIIRYCRLLILQPPEHGKTTFAEELEAWLITLTRTLKSLFISKTEDVAKDRLYRIKTLLEDESWYIREGLRNPIREWGPFKPTSGDTRPWAQNKFYVLGSSAADRNATVEARGIGNQIQGHRTDVGVLDDVFVPENQYSESERKKQLTWLGQTMLARLPADGGLCLGLGTRALSYDNYNVLLNGGVFTSVVQPAIIDEGNKVVLWVEHWPLEKLQQRRDEVVATAGPAAWLLTYQQQAIDMPGSPFRREALEASKDRTYAVGQILPGLVTVMGVDPAITGECAIWVNGLDRATGHRWVIDVRTKRGLGNIDAFRKFVTDAARDYGCRAVRIEKNAMQGYLSRDPDLRAQLGDLNCKLEEEFTSRHNKFNPDWGVLSVAAKVEAGLYHFPALGDSERQMQPTLDELMVWRPEIGLKQPQNRVMAGWLAELSCRQYEMVGDLPKPSKRVPRFVRKSFDHRMARVR